MQTFRKIVLALSFTNTDTERELNLQTRREYGPNRRTFLSDVTTRAVTLDILYLIMINLGRDTWQRCIIFIRKSNENFLC